MRSKSVGVIPGLSTSFPPLKLAATLIPPRSDWGMNQAYLGLLGNTSGSVATSPFA